MKDRTGILMFKREPAERRDSLYRTVEYMALRGFHASTIARVCGITVSQVYTACGQMRIKLRAYRDGVRPVAREVLAVAPVVANAKRKARG